MKRITQTVLIASVAISSFINPARSAGSQNPFGQASNDQLNSGGSFGSQNPFGPNAGADSGPGTQSPSPGGTLSSGSASQTHGCPAERAQAPSPRSNLNYAVVPPVCPLADGKLYQSPDGATFFIQCCRKGHSSPVLVFEAADFKSCMDKCSRTDKCHSVQYAARINDALPTSQCQLFEPGDYLATQSGNSDMHNYAFIIDPPAIESPDAATIKCSTECPYSDGQQFVTSVGEVFRMDCGKRHGTRVIYQDTQEALQDCIEACGKLVACHSVDYDAPRKVCYYGNHQAPPTISAPSFGSAYSMGCDGACGGNGCGKRRRCKCPCRPPTCSPGIERAIYDNIYKGNNLPNYPSFNPNGFKGKTPESTNIVQDISFHNSDATGPLANKAVMYRTYLYTCETGDYKFVSNSVDDIALMWFGTKALGNYDRSNADLIQTFSGSNTGPQTVIRTVSARTYYPILIWFGDQGGAADLQFRIYGPGGAELTGQPAGQSFFTTKPCRKGVAEFDS